MTSIVDAVIAAIERRDWDRLTPMLHPYLHWSSAGGVEIRGRTNVLAHLASSARTNRPISHELRDGQIYRWVEPPAAASPSPGSRASRRTPRR